MQVAAPVPPGAGAVMWWASAVEAEPSISPKIVAPRAFAADHSSSTSTAAPSAITNPSRRGSNGRLTPLLESAVMLVKPAIAVGVNGASLPPASTASQIPLLMRRAALPMAWVPAAQAVTVFSDGPCQPCRIDRAAEAALVIIIGTRNGETRRSPLARRVPICVSRVSIPPTPVPMKVPRRVGSAVSSPACARAWSAAAIANWVNRSLRLTSLGFSK